MQRAVGDTFGHDGRINVHYTTWLVRAKYHDEDTRAAVDWRHSSHAHELCQQVTTADLQLRDNSLCLHFNGNFSK